MGGPARTFQVVSAAVVSAAVASAAVVPAAVVPAAGAEAATKTAPCALSPSRIRLAATVAGAVFLAAIGPDHGCADTPVAWVELVGPGRQASIRVLVDKDANCPTLTADGRPLTMRVRAEPGPLLHEGKLPPAADFPVKVCEVVAPEGKRVQWGDTTAVAGGRHPPHRRLRRHRMPNQEKQKAAKLRQARQMALCQGGRTSRTSCELSLGCPSGPGRGSWSCDASAILGRTG
jgi:hypothetical protein